MTIRPVLHVHAPARLRRGLLGAAAILIVAGAAACGTSSNPASSIANAVSSALSGAASSGTHEFSASLSITGTVSKSTTFTETLEFLPACASLAKTGFSGVWSLPVPASANATYLNANVETYTGPGTYSNQSVFQDSVTLYAPYQGTIDEFNQVSGSNVSVTVNSDGSGKATFTMLQDNDQLNENGTETWTCS
jgi:hypothetical protein